MQEMPVVFVGHGSPMNALEDNAYTQGWKKAFEKIPRPEAILAVSAHWETGGTRLTANKMPNTIHDFGGFPPALHAVNYPAPGSEKILSLLPKLDRDLEWGLDHGTWSVLKPVYPKADIPVVQISLDIRKSAAEHYAFAKTLRHLRSEGVLILGSGNIVHNLRAADFSSASGYPWAVEFDQWVANKISLGKFSELTDVSGAGESAKLSVPTREHYLPLLYVLAAGEGGKVTYFNDVNTMGSISMRSVMVV
jgi:4,5-DOPA dioxygenase extradiol